MKFPTFSRRFMGPSANPIWVYLGLCRWWQLISTCLSSLCCLCCFAMSVTNWKPGSFCGLHSLAILKGFVRPVFTHVLVRAFFRYDCGSVKQTKPAGALPNFHTTWLHFNDRFQLETRDLFPFLAKASPVMNPTQWIPALKQLPWTKQRLLLQIHSKSQRLWVSMRHTAIH